MTTNDLLILEMVFNEPLRKTEQNTFSFLKFIIFVDLERKNKFHGNHATYRSESYYASYYSFDNFLVEKSHFF